MMKSNEIIPITNKTILYVENEDLRIFPIQANVFYENLGKSIALLEEMDAPFISDMLSTSLIYAEMLKKETLEHFKKVYNMPRGKELAPGIIRLSHNKFLITGFSMRHLGDKISKARKLRMLLPIAGASTFIVGSMATIVLFGNNRIQFSDITISYAGDPTIIYEVSSNMKYAGGTISGGVTAKGSPIIPGSYDDELGKMLKQYPLSMFHKDDALYRYYIGYNHWNAEGSVNNLLPSMMVAMRQNKHKNLIYLGIAWESSIGDVKNVAKYLSEYKDKEIIIVFILRVGSSANDSVDELVEHVKKLSPNISIAKLFVEQQRFGVSKLNTGSKYAFGFAVEHGLISNTTKYTGYGSHDPAKYCAAKGLAIEKSLHGFTREVKYGEPVFTMASDGSLVFTSTLSGQVLAYKEMPDTKVSYGAEIISLTKKVKDLLALIA